MLEIVTGLADSDRNRHLVPGDAGPGVMPSPCSPCMKQLPFSISLCYSFSGKELCCGAWSGGRRWRLGVQEVRQPAPAASSGLSVWSEQRAYFIDAAPAQCTAVYINSSLLQWGCMLLKATLVPLPDMPTESRPLPPVCTEGGAQTHLFLAAHRMLSAQQPVTLQQVWTTRRVWADRIPPALVSPATQEAASVCWGVVSFSKASLQQ